MKAKEEVQVSVFLGNHPGVVAELSTALAEAKISIRALTVLDTVDVGTLRLIVDDVKKAADALKNASAASVEVPVISIEVPNRLGAFGDIARIMANAGVNIEYVYASSLRGTERSLAIFRVSDLDTALKLDYPDD